MRCGVSDGSTIPMPEIVSAEQHLRLSSSDSGHAESRSTILVIWLEHQRGIRSAKPQVDRQRRSHFGTMFPCFHEIDRNARLGPLHVQIRR